MPIISIRKHTECLQLYYHGRSYNSALTVKPIFIRWLYLDANHIHCTPSKKSENPQLFVNEASLSFLRAQELSLLLLPWSPFASSVFLLLLSER